MILHGCPQCLSQDDETGIVLLYGKVLSGGIDLMDRHEETMLEIHELGSRIPPYRPTFELPGRFIDRSHRNLAECPVQHDVLIQIKTRRWFGKIIPGWLRREDALKLYEMAYYAAGDILELGSFHGLSTSILARASRNSPDRKHIYTVDLDPTNVRATMDNLRLQGLDRGVTASCEDAAAAVRRFASEGKQFGFVFIDHAHSYDPVYQVCRELERVTRAGGFCLLHDFNDPRNRDPDAGDYGVYQAVMDGLNRNRFEFYGIYGCTALY
jgi:predicted O-methyltransferase YrrM